MNAASVWVARCLQLALALVMSLAIGSAAASEDYAALKQRLGVDINGLLRMANHADGAEIAPSRGTRARHAMRAM